jgi:acylphosphatase
MAGTAVRIIVSGLVQGVGFRYYIYRQANSLGLNGQVRNLPSGQVEIIAAGEKGLIDELVKAARVGPSYASVSKVSLEEFEPDEPFTSFRIY